MIICVVVRNATVSGIVLYGRVFMSAQRSWRQNRR